VINRRIRLSLRFPRRRFPFFRKKPNTGFS